MKPETAKAGLAGLHSLVPAAMFVMQTSKSEKGWWAGVWIIGAAGAIHILRMIFHGGRALK